ncbi:MAG: signaling protein, partial [Acidobacteria bacterium]|nr:signaling protein [Acidobacteriota bacterium]
MRLFLPLLQALAAPAADLCVSTRGDDAARHAVRQARQKSHCPITVHFRAGTYYLPATVGFTPEDSGTAATPIAYIAEPGETVVLSGGTRLRIEWRPYRDGILQAHVPPGLTTDQLFVNGQRQPMARYPNRDPHARYFEGRAAGTASKARAARWANPQGGFHSQITGKDPSGELTMIGGWQNNRRLGIHDQSRFVENIFEELDAPGEWFLNSSNSTLYFYPPTGLDPSK